jgi:UDP-MurNAc hydroxylase
VHFEGKTLLTDPWYVDPTDCNATFHWPPVVHDVDRLASETNAIWISHVHPDHFDPRSLSRFPRHVPVVIGDYRRKGFRNALEALGFEVCEVAFQTVRQIPGTQISVSILESDYAESAAYDSAIVVRTPEFTVFDNNDCYLGNEKYEWVRSNFAVDYAFLGYSPASFYPICFEFPEAEKNRLLHAAAERRYGDFVNAARLLNARLSVPFAMGIRFLHPSMLWQNVEFNRAQEAVRRARTAGLAAECLWPGDRIGSGGIERIRAIPSESEEDADLLAYAAQLRERIESVWNEEAPARRGLVDSFREYMTALWNASRERYPAVADNIIAFEVEGPAGGRFHFDFSRRADDIFVEGIPPRFDMRYDIPTSCCSCAWTKPSTGTSCIFRIECPSSRSVTPRSITRCSGAGRIPASGMPERSGAGMQIPVILSVDIGPDDAILGANRLESPGWERSSAGLILLRNCFRRMEDECAAAIPVTWFVRADPAIQRQFGSMLGVFRKFDEFLAAARQDGHEIGWLAQFSGRDRCRRPRQSCRDACAVRRCRFCRRQRAGGRPAAQQREHGSPRTG